MPAAIQAHDSPPEVAILARVLGGHTGTLPARMARYILEREFSQADQARMHDLSCRNQEDGLSAVEKEELLAYAKAGALLSILKSRARRTLRAKLKGRTA